MSEDVSDRAAGVMAVLIYEYAIAQGVEPRALLSRVITDARLCELSFMWAQVPTYIEHSANAVARDHGADPGDLMLHNSEAVFASAEATRNVITDAMINRINTLTG